MDKLPTNVEIKYNNALASDEAPWSVEFCGQFFAGNSPEECFKRIAASLEELQSIKDSLKPFFRR